MNSVRKHPYFKTGILEGPSEPRQSDCRFGTALVY